MENPNLTFLSSSLLAGDRSLTNVVAHEITHSWAGNYTTNASWSDFWLNEGFTVYIERMILGKMNSPQYRDFESLIGYYDLIKTMEDLGPNNEFTKLQPNLVNTDPDEAFSKIPYEKGSLFLRYLEKQVGGIEAMQRWLKAYFSDFRFKSLSTSDMKNHFINFFTNVEKVKPEVMKALQWDHFLLEPGMPSFDAIGLYDSSLSERCSKLASKWIEKNGEGATPTDLDDYKSREKMFFLDTLITKATPMKTEILLKIEELYKLSSSKNVEILFRYFMLCLKSHHHAVLPHVGTFLSKYGRGLYVKPLYKILAQEDKNFARKVYEENKSFYHSIICSFVEGVVKK